MRLAPPPIVRTLEALRPWLQELHAAFAQGLGFPPRFQMGSIFITTDKGDPATNDQTSADPTGSLYLRTDGGAGSTLYVKEVPGWAAK